MLHMSNNFQTSPKIALFFDRAKRFFLEVFVPVEKNHYLPKILKSKYLFWYGIVLLAIKITLLSLVLILPTTNFFSAIAAGRLMALINQERQIRNLPALTINNSLNSAAGLKIDDMLAQNYFDHTSPAGLTPWYWFKKIGYNYTYAGENLAMGFNETDAVFKAWMNSLSHRDNILNPNFKEMGLAVRAGQIQNQTQTLAVLVFGQQAQTIKKPAVKTAPSKTKSAAAPKVVSAPTSILTPSAKVAILPIATPSATPFKNSSPAATPTTLVRQTASKIITQAENEIVPNNKIGYVPQVLGAFTSKSDEIFKSLYLYFTLFMAIALLVNIFVKIKIQYWTTIGATISIILLSTVLVFI